jgi:putative aldouronate transport system permease protein
MKKEIEEDASKLNRISKPTNILFYIIFIFISFICIIPVIFVFMISITSEKSLAKYGYKLIPKELSADAYLFLLKESETIIRSLGVSCL